MLRVFFLLFLASCCTLRAQEYQVYILSGQSNMDGRGSVSELPKELADPQKNVLLFYRNGESTKTWVPLTGGYSKKPGFKGTLPSDTFGPEVSFGFQMAKAFPDQHLALLKACKGGTSLSKDWVPGKKDDAKSQGPQYRNLIAALTESQQAMKEKGDTFVIRGMLWHQGESDAGVTAEEYQKLLTEFIGRVREDLQLPKLPFVIGEVYDNGKREPVRTAQKAVAQAVPHVGFISAKDTKTSDGGTHFNAASQVLLGERFATEMQRLLKAP